MTIRKIAAISSLVFCLFLTGCSLTSSTTYYWGNYESLLYDMYVEPGKATPQIQIHKLTTDIQQAENKGKTVPPGVYAHLGFMYSIDGNIEAATNAFNKEKALYPDSQILIDGMLTRANDIASKQ